MNVLDYIAHETERQSGTVREALGMYGAWHYAQATSKEGWAPNAGMLTHMVKCINGQQGYRVAPAVFNQGRPAVDAQNIPRLMDNLIRAIYDAWMVGLREDHADYFTKEFLDIHPFADGNGRVASIMWNWLNRTLADPEPMPYFYGKHQK